MFLGKGSSAQGIRPVYQAQVQILLLEVSQHCPEGRLHILGVVLVFHVPPPRHRPVGPTFSGPSLRLIAIHSPQALWRSPTLRAYLPAAVTSPGLLFQVPSPVGHLRRRAQEAATVLLFLTGVQCDLLRGLHGCWRDAGNSHEH